MHRAFMKINFHVMTRKRYHPFMKEEMLRDPLVSKSVKDLSEAEWKNLQFGLKPFRSKKK